MAKSLHGMKLVDAYKVIKTARYTVTAMCTGWFRCERSGLPSLEIEYDGHNYITRVSVC